jgi:DNA polymerase II large subunit
MENGKKTTVDVAPCLKDPFIPISFSHAKTVSEELGIPLHPAHTWFYIGWTLEETKGVMDEIRKANDASLGLGLLHFSLESGLKKRLERAGIPHTLEGKEMYLNEEASEALRLFTRNNVEPIREEDTPLSILSRAAGIEIKDKVGTFSGARMGRPEAATPRVMKGNPHVLFPIGIAGGATRSINKAAGLVTIKGKTQRDTDGKTRVEIGLNECPSCHEVGARRFCIACNIPSNPVFVCTSPECLSINLTPICARCNYPAKQGTEYNIDVRKEIEWAAKNLVERIPEPVKGVKGLISDEKKPEPLEKGILRAKHDLHVFRDGTMRFELLNAPMTHFYPHELGMTVEKARQLGYTHDAEGNPLERDDQMVEMFVQDVIVNDGCGDWLLRASKFVDDLLVKFYKIKPYYNAKTKEDMIGHLLIGLAPHTSAGIVARVIGYSKSRLGWGHPYFIMCKRRNCLTGDTPVMVREGNQLKSVPISYFDDGSKNEEIPLKGIQAYTIDKKGKIHTQKAMALLKQKSPEELLQFKTKFGREITTTPNHKLLTCDGKKVYEKESSKFIEGENLLSLHTIKLGKTINEFNVMEFYAQKTLLEKKKLRVHGLKDKLIPWIKKNGGYAETARRIGHQKWKAIHTAVDFDSIPLDVLELLAKDMGKKVAEFRECRIGYNKQKSTIPAVIPLTKELGEIIGYYLADGCFRTTKGIHEKFVYQINFVSDERLITQRLEGAILKSFGRNVAIERRKLDAITLSGRVYYEFFTHMLGTGKKAKTKRVPFLLMNAPPACLEGLLAGYIVGDGHINANSIKMTSVNKALISDFSLVCNLLGLFPHLINEKERIITSGYLKEFYAKKNRTISIHAYGIRLYSDDLKKMGPHLFGKKGEKFKEIMKTHAFRGKRLKHVGNFALDRIVEIKKIKSTEEWVYDLIVEGEKNYIAGFGNLGVYDCDGDQDSVMLLMDSLLNFSHTFLGHSRGGRMDAPLVFTVALNPQEIDDEVHEMETCSLYPISFYDKTLTFSEPKVEEVPVVKKKLGKEDQYIHLHYSHTTKVFDKGPMQSSYTKLKSMEEKLDRQAKLQSKLAPLQFKDSLERVIVSHLFPDIIGNTRAFSRQTFRCTKCNAKYRRLPLTGNCQKCTGGNIILTIAQGSVRKYLEIAKKMIHGYDLSEYLKQRIRLAETEIDAVFPPEKQTQKSLFEFA